MKWLVGKKLFFLNFKEVFELKTVAKNVYEAMFLVDSAQAATDWEGTGSLIKAILEKAEAEIISFRKWDERKLAYDIAKKSRGTYILCYFNAPTSKIAQIERDVQLSEKVMRVLILRADHLTKEDMEKETPIMIAQREGVAAQDKPQQSADGSRTEQAPHDSFVGRENIRQNPADSDDEKP